MKIRRILSAATLLLSIVSSIHAGQYFQDFSAFSIGTTTNFGDGSALFSTTLGFSGGAEVQDNTFKELQLTESGDPNVTSAFELPDLDPGAPVYAFSVKWNSQVFGNFPNAADGFSFNFGQLASLNLASGAVESGYGTGLSFDMQNYNGNNPGFYVRVNGSTLASVPYDASTQWRTNNGTRHFFEVDWNYTNGLSVHIDGQMIFSNATTHGFVPHAGDRMVWAARCGSLSEEVRLDNIVAMTGGNLVQVPATSPYFGDANTWSGEPASAAFDGDNASDWLTFFTNGYVGATISSPATVAAYVMTSGNLRQTTDPRLWELQGSSNGGTTWSNCGSGNVYFVNSVETRGWLATNSLACGAYRLNILANNGDLLAGNQPGDTTVGELRFYQFNPVAPRDWFQTAASDGKLWHGIASSADGTKLAACQTGFGGGIYTSTNSGATFQSGPDQNQPQWSSVASSADGTKLAAVVYTGGIYTSANSGGTWTQTSAPTDFWRSIAISTNGNTLAAVSSAGAIYVSTNSGSTWLLTSAPGDSWYSIASSADGTKLAAASSNAGIFTSTNTGVSWTHTSAINDQWNSIASSADGTKLAAATFGAIYTSTDSGGTWTLANAPGENWISIASSADGTKLAAAVGSTDYVHGTGGGIYISTDSGSTWTQSAAPFELWESIATSADGSKLAAVASDSTVSLGGIWTYGPITILSPPTASTDATIPIAAGARLNGQVVQNNLPTAAWFEWGTSTNYGNATAVQNIGDGIDSASQAAAVSAILAGLSPVTYHYRMVAMNDYGTNYGNDEIFTTLASNAFFNIIQSGDSVTPTSANSPDGQDAIQGIDGTASSKYLNFDITNTGLTIFPAITNLAVDALGLISAEDAPERDPASFAIYGSHDGTNFSLIASNSVPLFIARNAIQSLSFANTNTYAAYKIIFPTVQNPSSANSMQIAEVELLPYADITSPNDALTLLLPGGASLNGPGQTNALLDRLLGGDTNKIVVLNDTTNVTALITPAAGASVVKGFELISGDDGATYPEREPVSFTLEGSNDRTNFTTLLAVTPQAPTTNIQAQDYEILGNTNACKIYRATFGAPQSGNVLQIGELRLFGVTSPQLAFTNSGGNLLLAWPASGFTLQQNTNLAAPWFTATNGIVVTNGRSSVAIPKSGGNNFYRLKSQ